MTTLAGHMLPNSAPGPTNGRRADSTPPGAARPPLPVRAARTTQRITADGVMFVLVTFAIGFAAYNTGTSLLYLMLSMMLAFLAMSGIMAYHMLRKLDVRRLVPGRAFARRATAVTLEVRNRKRFFASYSLRLRDLLAADLAAGSTYIFHLAPRASQQATYEGIFPTRGWHELSGVELATRYPFGFFERRKVLPLSERVLVYPELLELREPARSVLHLHGSSESTERGEGVSLHSLRDYTSEDSARRIVWKVSARVNRLIVSETEREAETRHHVALNNRVPAGSIDGAARDRFERALSFVASLALDLFRRNELLTVYTPDGTVTVKGPSDLDRLLRSLALLELLPDETEAAPVVRAPGTRAWTPRSAVQLLHGTEQHVCARTLPIGEWSKLIAGPKAARPEMNGRRAEEAPAPPAAKSGGNGRRGAGR